MAAGPSASCRKFAKRFALLRIGSNAFVHASHASGNCVESSGDSGYVSDPQVLSQGMKSRNH